MTTQFLQKVSACAPKPSLRFPCRFQIGRLNPSGGRLRPLGNGRRLPPCGCRRLIRNGRRRPSGGIRRPFQIGRRLQQS